MRIILASASPRRKELLGELVQHFTIVQSGVDEMVNTADPLLAAKEISFRKAEHVFREHGDCLVIGADTIVAFNGGMFGKPGDAYDAKRMLKALSGNRHEVFTAVTLLWDGGRDTFADRSEVYFKKLTEKQIDDYVASGSPFDKAGAYGIQDSGFVEKIEGSFKNVMGLPSEMLKERLNQINI